MNEIYLTLYTLPSGASTSIGIDRELAFSLDRKGFIKLYRKTVWGSKKKEAGVWADEQIRLRAEGLAEAQAVMRGG